MPRGPRSYSAATDRALFMLSKENCYYPECPRPVIVFIDGEPETNVQISHIRGAYPNSARYDETMTDAERAAFANLILLCTPHHNLVDRKRPDDFSPEVLHGWKAEREGAAVEESEGELFRFDEDVFRDAMESAVRRLQPSREVTLEIAGAAVDADQSIVMPLSKMKNFLKVNTHLRGRMAPYVALTVRNTGHLLTSIDHLALHCRFDIEDQPEMILAGRDDLPGINPRLPATLDIGHSLTWHFSFVVFEAPWLMDRKDQPFADFKFKVTLGSGEEVSSAYEPSHRVKRLDW